MSFFNDLSRILVENLCLHLCLQCRSYGRNDIILSSQGHKEAKFIIGLWDRFNDSGSNR